MTEILSSVAKARTVSGLSQTQAAAIVGLKSYQTYSQREQKPETLMMIELKHLYDAFNEDGKHIIRNYCLNFFDL